MKNLAIGLRLAFSFLLMLLITFAVAASGYWGVGRIADVVDGMLAGDYKQTRFSDDGNVAVLELRRFEKDYLLSLGDAQSQEKYAQEWSATSKKLLVILDDLAKLATEDEDRRAVETARRELGAYEAGFSRVQAAVRSGEAVTPQDANRLMGEYKEPIRSLSDALASQADKHGKDMEDEDQVIEASKDSVRNTMVLILVVGVIFGVAVSLYITQSITSPIAMVVNVVEKMAAGDLRESPTVDRTDETGRLLQAVKTMVEKLGEVIGEVRGG
ncbi:MAG TPA: methyl-accepting chemotaxis protein, partial [Anaeromyxobacteraceae bacterium]|nr:methyl-accepting chemotaxis protein [Anaeromyxobacteraceae bacterium]